MKKFLFFTRLLTLAAMLSMFGVCAQAQDPSTAPAQAVTQVAPQFDGKALYKAVFETLRDNHIMLQDPATRAKWVAEWEHKHDADGTLNTEESADKVTLEMIRSLNQRFDYYLLPEDTKDEAQRMDPSLVGIGAQVQLKNANAVAEPIIKALPKDATRAQKIEASKKIKAALDSLTASQDHPVVVVAPMEGGPAEKAGILANDVITKVNGQPVDGKKLQEIVDSLRGKPGVEVKVTIERIDAASGKKVEQTFVIKRARVVSHVAHYKDLGNGISYIKLDDFSSKFAANEMHDALVKAVTGSAVIIDLRGNPGGRLDLVEVIAAFFMPEGTVLEQHSRNKDDLVTDRIVLQPDFVLSTEAVSSKPGNVDVETGKRPPVMLPDNMPVIVLVDQWSASASEILSGALQANHRAVIVGQPTVGKGVGQIVVQLPAGRSMHVTNFEFLPGGKAMDWVGVVPDIEVTQPADDTASGATPVDAQLEAAKKAALDLVAKQSALSKERQDLKQKHHDEFEKSKSDPNN